MSLPVSVPLQPTHGRSITADRTLLRLSATLPFIGFLLYALASIFHHDPANSNNHIVTFTLYKELPLRRFLVGGNGGSILPLHSPLR